MSAEAIELTSQMQQQIQIGFCNYDGFERDVGNAHVGERNGIQTKSLGKEFQRKGAKAQRRKGRQEIRDFLSEFFASWRLCAFALKSSSGFARSPINDFMGAREMTENEISKIIVNSAIEVHRTLGGSGLLESVYEEALAWELSQAGFKIQRQDPVPIRYKGQLLAIPLKIDLIVDELVIVECKSASKAQRRKGRQRNQSLNSHIPLRPCALALNAFS